MNSLIGRWLPLSAVFSALLMMPGVGALAAQQGVTDTEIVVGTTTDLSGVTAIQGVNNANTMRMVFDEANANGGINGRKIHYIVEDTQYQVPRAVQAINKLLNLDHVFFTVVDGGTPMNNAEMPMQFAKNVPNIFPLTAARSMYEPFNPLKFGQFASYYDQMRSGVKYFVEKKHVSHLCVMYQDTDFGRDVLAGVQDETKALGLSIVATTAHKPTDADFSSNLTKLRDAGCDWVAMGTIVRDTIGIISQARTIGWSVPFVGQVASYDTSIATAPGGVGEGFYSMSPSIYAYPDDPRPAVKAFFTDYKARYGIEPNFLGETGYSAAQMVLMGLKNAGKDLTTESFIKGLEAIHSYTDIFGTKYSFGPNQHHGETASYLSVIHNGRWEPVQTDAIVY
ncbi:MAG TPA: ABC transporter substrate-binding protein [Rhodopila sp.]|jgi:branched-chain amino acid transport system substrate-binding protein